MKLSIYDWVGGNWTKAGQYNRNLIGANGITDAHNS
jgi:hypothetical protein